MTDKTQNTKNETAIDVDEILKDINVVEHKLVESDEVSSKYAKKVQRRRVAARQVGMRGVPPFPVIGMEHRSQKAKDNSRHQLPPRREPTVRELAEQWV